MAESQRQSVPRDDTGELDTALAFLQFARECLLKKAAGLEDEQLRRVLVPTGTNLLGLIQHMAVGERYWFGHHVAGQWPRDTSWDFTMAVPADRTTDDVLRAYRAACVRRAEVGSIASEDRDPLLAGVLDGLGDKMGDVVLAAAGHPDVGCRGGAVLTDHGVSRRRRVALSAVDGRGVGELDMCADVVLGQDALTPGAGDDDPAVGVDGGDGPLITVRHSQRGVVATRCDAVAGTNAFTGDCGHAGVVGDGSGADEPVADSRIEGGDLLAGVCDYDACVTGRGGCGVGQRGEPVGVTVVYLDLFAVEQRVEHRRGVVAGAHRQAQRRVLVVRFADADAVCVDRAAGEAVHRVQRQVRVRVDVAGGEVEHAAASDRW